MWGDLNMSLGFRKSLFGYNCEEVYEYIHSETLQNKQIVDTLNNDLRKKASEIEEHLSVISQLQSEIDVLKNDVALYKDKYDEVKNLSDNIGKLYIVAQSNAKSIMQAADNAKQAAQTEIQQNLNAIDTANDSINNIKLRFEELCREFSDNVDSLNASLIQTKQLIENSNSETETTAQGFESFYNSLAK